MNSYTLTEITEKFGITRQAALARVKSGELIIIYFKRSPTNPKRIKRYLIPEELHEYLRIEIKGKFI